MNQNNDGFTVRAVPGGLIPIFVADLFERFAYYTMLSVLIIFSFEGLGLGGEEAGTMQAAFLAGAYLLPLFGGLIGDFAGHGRAILIGTILTTAGLGALTISALMEYDGIPFAILGLALVAHGVGFFKASSMAMIANLHQTGRHSLSPFSSYVIYYTCTNLGAAFAPTVASLFTNDLGRELNLDPSVSFALAFFVCTLAMVIALVFISVSMSSLRKADRASRDAGPALVPSETCTSAFRGTSLAVFLVILFFMTIPYGGLFSWVMRFFQEFSGQGPDPNYLLGLNPALIVLLAPVLAIVLGIMRRKGIRVNPLFLVGIGGALIAAGLGLMTLVSAGLAPSDGIPTPWHEDPISSGWAYLVIALITLGEILYGPAIIFFVATTAPRRLRGLMLGVYMAVMATAHYAQEPFSMLWESAPPSVVFGVALVIAAVCTGMFFLVGFKMRVRESD